MGRRRAYVGVQRKIIPQVRFLDTQLALNIERKIYYKKTTTKVSIMETSSRTSLFRQSRDSPPSTLNSNFLKTEVHKF